MVATFSTAGDETGSDGPGGGIAYCLSWVGREAAVRRDTLADGFLGSPLIDSGDRGVDGVTEVPVCVRCAVGPAGRLTVFPEHAFADVCDEAGGRSRCEVTSDMEAVEAFV